MKKMTAPWLSRPALAGAAIGLLAGLVVAAGAAGGAGLRVAIIIGFAAGGYLGGFAVAARRLLAEAARHLARLHTDLRASQDHMMATGSSRSLPSWLAVSAPRLRELLTALAGSARGLAADATLSETTRAAAAAIVERADQLAKVTAPLVGYTQPDPARAPFDLNTQVREALVLCRHRAEEKSIRFLEGFAVLPPVFGPATRVQAALLNVIVNAIEAMPFGGGTITLATSHEGDRVVLRVVDGGIGIRPEHLAKVTDPFFTTKPEKAAAGLGLWETRVAVEAIGGTLDIRSVPHQGTEVTFSFPQAAPLSAGRVGVAHPEEVSQNLADVGDRRIA